MYGMHTSHVKAEGCFDSKLVTVEYEADEDDIYLVAVHIGGAVIDIEMLASWVQDRLLKAVEDDIEAEAAEARMEAALARREDAAMGW